MNLGTIWAELGLRIDKFDRDLQSAEARMRTAQQTIESRARQIGDAFSAAEQGSKLLLAGLAGVAGAAAAAGLAGIKLAGDMEQSKIAFTTMLGSAEQADEFLRQLFDFAAKTPFEFVGLQKSARQLLAFGFDSKEVLPMLTALGDAVSGLGGGAVEIDRVTRALGQMQAKGKVSAEEMMQLAELGIPAWQMLADKLGVDIPTAMKLAEQGGIGAKDGISAIVDGMNERFGGMMERQSTTLLGLWSTAKDNATAVLRSFGEEIIKTFDLKDKLAGAIQVLSDFAALLQSEGLRGALAKVFPPEMQEKIALIAGAIVGALVPGLYALAASFVAAMAPLLPFMVIGAALAALAFLIYRNWETVGPFLTDLWNGVRDTALGVWNALSASLGDIWNGITKTAQAVWNALKTFWQEHGDGVKAILKIAWDQIELVVRTTINLVRDVIGVTLALIRGDWSEVWDRIKSILEVTWNGITGTVRNAIRGVATILSEVWDDIKGCAQRVWDGIEKAIGGAIDVITAPIRGFIALIESALAILDRFLGRRSAARASVENPTPAEPGAETAQPSLDVAPPGQASGWLGGWQSGITEVPMLHAGGVFRAPVPGGEGLALLRDRETVLPPGQLAGGSAKDVANAVGIAVYGALRDGLRGMGSRGNAAGELVIEIDGQRLARALIPALTAERRRMGLVEA
jgi:tape measure domain-containing protein